VIECRKQGKPNRAPVHACLQSAARRAPRPNSDNGASATTDAAASSANRTKSVKRAVSSASIVNDVPGHEEYTNVAAINDADWRQGKLLNLTASGETGTHIQIIE
jgi:hypothetical protein